MRSHLIPPEKWREFRKGKKLDEAKNTIREIQVFFTCDGSPKFRSIWNDDVTCCYGNDGCFDSLVVSLKQLANHIW